MMQDKRFFAFGCSYTSYAWPTWADMIGVNFDVYKNYGRPGCSNLYILQQFLEANDKYKFNNEDVIIVMFTGFARFSYFYNGGLNTHGELRSYYENTKRNGKPNLNVGMFLDSGVWSEDLGVTHSYTAAKTIKTILESVNCKYKIHLAIDNTHFIQESHRYFTIHNSLTLAEEFYNILDIKLSLDEWMKQVKYSRDEYYSFDNSQIDGHPTIKMHEDYVKTYFPEYYTNQSREFAQKETEYLDFTDNISQSEKYQIRKKYDYKFVN